MRNLKILTVAVASAALLATAVTPAAARWHGWGGVAAGIGAGLAIGALSGAYSSPYYGYGYPYYAYDYPYYGGYSYGGYGYSGYGGGYGCAQRVWWRGRWHVRYVC
jgi:hypothetical protein